MKRGKEREVCLPVGGGEEGEEGEIMGHRSP